MTRNYYLQIQAQRQGYKAAFIDAALWKVLTKTLGSLLKKDWDERLEDDKLIIERILILIRNVLQVPTNVRREGRTMDDVSLHDQVTRESILSHQVIMTLSRSYNDLFLRFTMTSFSFLRMPYHTSAPTISPPPQLFFGP